MIKSEKIKLTMAAVTLCVVSVSSVALAQEASTDKPLMQPTTKTATCPVESQVVSRCSQLIGTPVENQQGQCLGKIADVVVDFNNDHVSYCILGVPHGFFGKTRYLPVPLAAFQTSEDKSHLVLNANKANLLATRGFARNEWPSTITPAWGAEPATPVELPPAEVFAPIAPSAPPVVRSRYFDPVWGPPCQPRTASEAIDAMSFNAQYGYPVR
jgi:sporulation protein YlmC with PRC-barrel domain